MSDVALTKMSSKGQVVVPKNIRESMGLVEGAVFAMYGDGDVLILKCVDTPSKTEMEAILKKGHDFARRSGIKPSDVNKALRESRKEKSG